MDPDLKILLTEDNELSANIYKEMLEENGCKVDWAEDGVYAIEKITAKPDYYDLILMDIQMPKLNGYDTAIQLRNRGIKTPIIAMSANTYSENYSLIEASGMNAFVAKPISVSKLDKIIKKCNLFGKDDE